MVKMVSKQIEISSDDDNGEELKLKLDRNKKHTDATNVLSKDFTRKLDRIQDFLTSPKSGDATAKLKAELEQEKLARAKLEVDFESVKKQLSERDK